MVCSIGSGKMTALAGLLGAGSVSQTVTGEAGHMKSAAQYLRRKLCEADEENLLDEEDMHIFGFRPMTDPLDLVCCNACKKPIKASQYAAHAELCKSLSSILDAQTGHDGLTINRKPPRKERKKLPVAQSKKATSLKHPKNVKAVDSEDIDASESHGDETIQMTKFVDTKRNMCKSHHKTNGSRVCQYTEECSEHVRICSSKPLKRGATESLSSAGTKTLGEIIVEVQPHKFLPPPGVTFSDAPAPVATKIYYSQRNYHLRRAIYYMFCDESRKESSSEVSNLDVLQANAAPRPTSNSNFCQEQSENQQER